MLAFQINKLLIISTICCVIAHIKQIMAVYKNALKVNPLVPFNVDLVKPDVQGW